MTEIPMLASCVMAQMHSTQMYAVSMQGNALGGQLKK
jgi:hypothetical protein